MGFLINPYCDRLSGQNQTALIQRDVCYVHIAKTAGSSMRMSIEYTSDCTVLRKGHNFKELFWKPLGIKIYIIGHDSRQAGAMTLERLKRELSPNCFVFAFLRHPLERLVSAYDFLHQANSLAINEHDRQDAERLVKPYCSFEEFVQVGLRSRSDEICFQPHFRPQSSLVCDSSGNLMLDFVARFESLTEDLRELENLFHLKFAPMPHVNISKRSVEAKDLSAETVGLVKQIYRHDFALYDAYCGKPPDGKAGKAYI